MRALDGGPAAVDPVRRLGDPILDRVGPRAWHVELAEAAAAYVPGRAATRVPVTATAFSDRRFD